MLETHGDIAILRLDTGKANAINPPMLAALEAGIDAFEAGASRALVLTGVKNAFCAGLDLPTLFAFDHAAIRTHMENFERVFLRVFTCARPVVAALNGHAIAGGCVLAMQADYRVLAEEAHFKMGLNETALAVGLPALVIETLRCLLPPTSFLQGALTGALHTPEGALMLGFVEDLAPQAAVEDRAVERATRLAEVPAPAFAQVKRDLRAPAVERIRATGPAVLDRWLDTWFSPEARALVGGIVERMK